MSVGGVAGAAPREPTVPPPPVRAGPAVRRGLDRVAQLSAVGVFEQIADRRPPVRTPTTGPSSRTLVSAITSVSGTSARSARSLIALFVGSFIIYNTFSILVAQRGKETHCSGRSERAAAKSSHRC
jgi:hypothetical protein